MCAEISIRRSFVPLMDIMNVVWLCREPNMMCYVLVFYGNDGKTIRKKTNEILYSRNMGERSWIEEIHKGTGDILVAC